MSVGVVAQRGNERAIELAAAIEETILEGDVDVVMDEATAAALDAEGRPIEALANCDLVASIGGDGTFLFVAHAVGDTPMLGVNLGEVGFLNVVAPSEAPELIREVHRELIRGTVTIQSLPRVIAEGEGWSMGPALNEIIIHAPQRGHDRGITVTVSVDGSRYARDLADGVMVATPTGSTAYNLSEGGPLLTPTIEGFVVTEMCGREPMPSLVVPRSATVSVDVEGEAFAYVISDSRSTHELSLPATVRIREAATPVRIAGRPLEFFDALSKLD